MTGIDTTDREAVLPSCPPLSLPAPRHEHGLPAGGAVPLPPARVVVIEAGPQPLPSDQHLAEVDADGTPARPRRRASRGAHREVGQPRPGERAGLLSGVATLMTAAVVVVFLALAVGPHTGLYRTTTMLTGSMQPFLSPGDVLVLTPEPIADLQPGDVVTFNAPVPGSPVFTHRVVSVDRSGARPVMTTKGDANAGPDAWQAALGGDTIWTVRASVPGLGHALTALRTPLAQLLLSRVLPLLLLLTVLVTLWRPARPEDPDADPRVTRPEWRDHPVWLDLPAPAVPEPRGA